MLFPWLLGIFCAEFDDFMLFRQLFLRFFAGLSAGMSLFCVGGNPSTTGVRFSTLCLFYCRE